MSTHGIQSQKGANKDGVNNGYGLSACSHTFQTYNGFTEVYEFCTKCDKKKTEIEAKEQETKSKGA